MSDRDYTTSLTLDHSPDLGLTAIPNPADTSSIVANLLDDIGTAETKLVDLAGAIPENKYNWQPDGARSIRRVLLHVAANNYNLPAMLGFAPDATTGITTDSKTAVAFEERNLTKDSVIAELKESFAFAKRSLQGETPASVNAPVTLFGQPFTGQSWWILTLTHLHENLGQLIAYARVNGVKPPWS